MKIYHHETSQLLPEELESFFIDWGKRTSQKSLTLVTPPCGLSTNKENITMIEKYKKLGIIKETEEYNGYVFD